MQSFEFFPVAALVRIPPLDAGLRIEFVDFRLTQSPAEQLKFIGRPAEISDQNGSGIRTAAGIPVA